MKLTIEYNGKAVADPAAALAARTGIHITPPITKDFWLMRVPVSDKQAIVVFPKFGLYGVGFQLETNWNVNLPTRVPAGLILEHIKENKGDETIPDERCLLAIYMLQERVRELQLQDAIQAAGKTQDRLALTRLAVEVMRAWGAEDLLLAINDQIPA